RGGSRVSLEQYGGTRGCFGEHANVCRRSAHPSFGVSEAKLQTPGAENVPRERDGLFDIVRWVETRCCPHPEERACASASAKSNARARISKDEDDHGMALMLRDIAARVGSGSICARVALLLSMRAGAAHFKKSQAALRTRGTNLRLWETIAGCNPLFADCYLQRNPQLQRVESSAT